MMRRPSLLRLSVSQQQSGSFLTFKKLLENLENHIHVEFPISRTIRNRIQFLDRFYT